MTTRSEAIKAMRESGLPCGIRSVFRELADSIQGEGLEIPEAASPSLTELTERTGLGRSTLTGHLNVLEEHGWLHRTRRPGGQRTLYRLDIGEPLLSKPNPQPRSDVATDRPTTGGFALVYLDADELRGFEFCASMLLRDMPEKARQLLRERVLDDFDYAGENAPTDTQALPQMVRHAGRLIAELMGEA